MNTVIALFRGINVGGAHIIPMKELRSLLEGLGCQDVRTYIQSGNAVFRHRSSPSALSKKIRAAIDDAFGFDPPVLLMSRADLERAAANNPFPEGEADPKTLHLAFLTKAAKRPDLELLETLRANDERCELEGSVFYLHAPSGIARSKLAAKIDRALGVDTTSRNWRTVQKVLELAGAD